MCFLLIHNRNYICLIIDPCRNQFEATFFNQERLSYCTLFLYHLIQREQQRYSDIKYDLEQDLERCKKKQNKLEDVSSIFSFLRLGTLLVSRANSRLEFQVVRLRYD